MATSSPDHKRAAAAMPASPVTSYRDDPDALSMHTTRTDYEYDDAPELEDASELPSYDESVAASAPTRTADNRAQQPVDEYQVITAPKQRRWASKHTHSPHNAIGSETSIRMDDRLLDATELYEYINSYLRVIPPRPSIRIKGWHWQTTHKKDKKEKERVCDFDIVLSLQAYLPSARDKGWSVAYTADNSDKTYRGSFRKTRASGYKQDFEVGGGDSPSLQEWCQSFADSKASLKVFRVARQVVGLNTELIRRDVEPLIRSTHYRGHIEISFPLADKNVDIYTPHWVNKARLSWLRWLFYLTFLWIFTWPVLLLMTKRWQVYTVQWQFSRCLLVDVEGGQRQEMRFAVASERSWLNKHADLIRSLVLDKFHGDGTDMPVNVDVNASTQRASGQMPQTGNSNADNAVNIIHSSVSAWNALHGRAQSGGWGSDES